MHISLQQRRFPQPVIFAIMLGTLAATAASRAAAKEPAMPPQSTCGDTTCAYGFTCQVIPGACPLIACRAGEVCPPCDPQSSYVCAPSACATDADCGADTVCAAHETTQCPTSPPTCAPNTDCSPPVTTDPPGATSNCTTTTYRQCTPRWQLPCQTAADCGAGFTCDEQQSCGCSGGGTVGGGAPSGTSTPPATSQTPPDCTCTGTGTSACTVIPTSCNTDAECLPGWTCQVVPSARSCAVSSDGQPTCDPPPAVVKNCAPPYSSSSGTAVAGTPKAVDAPSPFAGCAVAGSERDSSGLASLLGLIMVAAAWLTRDRRHHARR
jgi:MYXO-CTERM domain-containing protein